VDTQAMIQDVGADPRVQFPEDAAPLESYSDLARAAVELADAIATGDESRLQALLTPSAQATLDQLTLTGEWYDATGAIEQVRIVFVSGEQAPPGIGSFDISAGIEEMQSSLESQFSGMTERIMQMARQQADQQVEFLNKHPDLKERTAKLFGLPADFTADDLVAAMESMGEEGEQPLTADQEREAMALAQETMERMTAEMGEEAMAAMMEEAMAEASKAAEEMMAAAQEASSSAVASSGAAGSVVLAIQQPGESYLMGWGAIEVGAGGWIFTGAPTMPETRARAAMWDGIGGGAFALGIGPGGSFGDQFIDFTMPDTFAPPPGQKDEVGPTIKRTPRGPVTIPGSG